MHFSDTVVQGEAIESDFENETIYDASQKVNKIKTLFLPLKSYKKKFPNHLFHTRMGKKRLYIRERRPNLTMKYLHSQV